MSETMSEAEIKENLKKLFKALRASNKTDVDECLKLIEDTFPTAEREGDLRALLFAIFALLLRDERLNRDALLDREFDDLARELELTEQEKAELQTRFLVSEDIGAPAAAPHRYYSVTAQHARNTSTPRRKPEVETDFRGMIYTIRVDLPGDKPTTPVTVQTSIGQVKSVDHVAFSVQELNNARTAVYGDLPPADAVHLITGGRRKRNRFTPVSLYLCYRGGNLLFWALQSSTFAGEPARLYVARDMNGEIAVHSGFKPTPFAYEHNMYTMKLRMNGDDPKELSGVLWSHSAQESSIEPNSASSSPQPASGHYRKYMTMTVSYDLLAKDPGLNSQPLMAQTEAFCRVCRIEDWVELPHYKQPDLGELAKLLHKTASAAGDRLRWRTRPPKKSAPPQEPPQ